MSYSVVILSANPTNLVACVRSVLDHEPALPPDHIIVVDDGARPEAEPHLPAVTWISGEKPFIFARNANLGIRAAVAAGHDVILLNDDARLETPSGFSGLVAQARGHEDIGILSAGIRGMVGNPRQLAVPLPTDVAAGTAVPVRIEPVTLAFIAVCIPRRTLETLGELDERFGGYGFDDNDYCARAHQAGLELGVWDGCVVEHGTLPPTFRSLSFWRTLSRQNEEAYVQKWRALALADLNDPARTARRPFTVVYTARNRLELTRETYATLWRNTNWPLVRQLVILDLGSGDGTNFWLESEAARMPVPTRFLFEPERTAEAVLAALGISLDDPHVILAENDTMQPPGWLRSVAARPGLPASEPGREPGPPGDDGESGPRPQNLELGPQYPRFDLTRLPYEPWAALADQYVSKGWQEIRPRYAPDSALWAWRWPDLTPATAATRPRFVGALRIKNEARWIGEVLERALGLCSTIYVLDDHSTDETPAICASFGERVQVIPSPFIGLDEARDKNYLLTRLVAVRPDWVLWIDGDEVLEQAGPGLLRAAADAAGSKIAAFGLRIAYLWDGPEQVRMDGLWGRFNRPSFFRLQGQPLGDLYFPSTAAGGNFHCGNVPRGLRGEVHRLRVRLKHYGYLERAHRQAKYVWYNQRDPGNEREDQYRHLAEIPGARHAPGPAEFARWEE